MATNSLIRKVAAALAALSLAVLLAGCSGMSVGVGIGDRYGSRRLPLDYFYVDSYYDGLWYDDYVCYDDYWYYRGYDTPYYWDYYDPFYY